MGHRVEPRVKSPTRLVESSCLGSVVERWKIHERLAREESVPPGDNTAMRNWNCWSGIPDVDIFLPRLGSRPLHPQVSGSKRPLLRLLFVVGTQTHKTPPAVCLTPRLGMSQGENEQSKYDADIHSLPPTKQQHTRSGMAQGKRAGLITRRSLDRNELSLDLTFFVDIFAQCLAAGS